MKRFLLLFLLVPALLLGGCSFSNREAYQQAQLLLGCGDYASAAQLFQQLGEYQDAGDYVLYCSALSALEEGQWAVARADMQLVSPFKSSRRYLQYLDALELEAAGQLEKALAAFQVLGSFAESLQHAQTLREAIPERDLAHARGLMAASRWEQAEAVLQSLEGYGESDLLLEQCRRRIQQEAYQHALNLYESGQYQEALTAFEALGDAMDADTRTRMCRSAMYHLLEEQYAEAGMANAQSLMDGYAEMEDYLSSPLRLKALQQRFAINLMLSEGHPYVLFGGRVWRVQQTEGHQVTLLAQSGLFTTVTDLPAAFAEQEEQAILTYTHPCLTLDLNRFSFTRGKGTAEEPYQ